MRPVELSLRYCRARGQVAGVVERFIHQRKIRIDLFGFADIMAFDSWTTDAVQTCTLSGWGDHVTKLESTPYASQWVSREQNRRTLLLGWRKKGRFWVVRVGLLVNSKVVVTLDEDRPGAP